MRRVLIVTALVGFIRSFLMSDIATLLEMGYEVHCAANSHHPGSDGAVELLDNSGVIFHQVDFSSSKPISQESYKAFAELKELRNSIDFDLIHCHTPIAGAIARAVFQKARNKGAVVLYTTHGFYFHKHSGRKSWLIFRSIEDFFSRYTDIVITINHEDYENARRMHCKDVRYIPGVGVDIDCFHNAKVDVAKYRNQLGLSKKDFVVLAVGELSKRKNHRVVIEALAQCDIENAVFVICGNAIANPEVKGELETLAKSLGVDVRFFGLRKDVPQICKCADIGVLPSLREGLGLAGIEMLASGLPLIGSNVQGIPDYLVDGVNGFLCDPTDSRSFAKAISQLMDAKLRSMFSSRGYESVRGFSKAKSELAMRKIYQKANSLVDGSFK